MPSRDDLIKRAFEPLSNAPDEAIPGGMNYESLPCPKKGCRGCKGPKCRSNNSNDSHGASKTGGQPTSTKRQSQTQQTSKAPTTTPSPMKSLASTRSSSSLAMRMSTVRCKGLGAR
jgi:hypothetical protein